MSVSGPRIVENTTAFLKPVVKISTDVNRSTVTVFNTSKYNVTHLRIHGRNYVYDLWGKDTAFATKQIKIGLETI